MSGLSPIMTALHVAYLEMPYNEAAASAAASAGKRPRDCDTARNLPPRPPLWIVTDSRTELLAIGQRASSSSLVAVASVESAADLSVARFESVFLRASRPVLIKQGCIDHWPARDTSSTGSRSWRDLRVLWRHIGARSVPVEVGSSYMAAGWSQTVMLGGTFLQRAFSPSGFAASASSPASDQSPEPGESCCMPAPRPTGHNSGLPQWPSLTETMPGGSAPTGGRGAVVYLAQHQLLEQVAGMASDVAVPDYCAACHDHGVQRTADAVKPAADEAAWIGEAPPPAKRSLADLPVSPASTAAATSAASDFAAAAAQASDCVPRRFRPRINVWIGPAGTRSDMHTDPEDNLLCQVFGVKRVLLVAPAHSAAIAAHTGVMSNTATVDPEDPMQLKSLRAGGVEVLEAVLGPGSVLFVPRGWWHHVRALSHSASVSFWWT